MKTSLDKLRSVTFKEELYHKSFLMNFAKFWRALLLNSSLPVKEFHRVVVFILTSEEHIVLHVIML